MKRSHRRIHFLIWIILAPLTIAATLIALSLAPPPVFTDLPAGIERGR